MWNVPNDPKSRKLFSYEEDNWADQHNRNWTLTIGQANANESALESLDLRLSQAEADLSDTDGRLRSLASDLESGRGRELSRVDAVVPVLVTSADASSGDTALPGAAQEDLPSGTGLLILRPDHTSARAVVSERISEGDGEIPVLPLASEIPAESEVHVSSLDLLGLTALNSSRIQSVSQGQEVVEDVLSEFETRVEQTESEVGVFASRIDQTENRQQEMRASLTIAADQIQSVVENTTYDDLGQAISSVGTRMTQTENEVGVFSERISNAEEGLLEQEGRLTVAEDQIESAVTRTEHNELGDLVSEQSSRLTIAEDQIESAVTQEQYDDLGEEISALGTRIDQEAGGVDLEAWENAADGSKYQGILSVDPARVEAAVSEVFPNGTSASSQFVQLADSVELAAREEAQSVVEDEYGNVETVIDSRLESKFTVTPGEISQTVSDYRTGSGSFGALLDRVESAEGELGGLGTSFAGLEESVGEDLEVLQSILGDVPSGPDGSARPVGSWVANLDNRASETAGKSEEALTRIEAIAGTGFEGNPGEEPQGAFQALRSEVTSTAQSTAISAVGKNWAALKADEAVAEVDGDYDGSSVIDTIQLRNIREDLDGTSPGRPTGDKVAIIDWKVLNSIGRDKGDYDVHEYGLRNGHDAGSSAEDPITVEEWEDLPTSSQAGSPDRSDYEPSLYIIASGVVASPGDEYINAAEYARLPGDGAAATSVEAGIYYAEVEEGTDRDGGDYSVRFTSNTAAEFDLSDGSKVFLVSWDQKAQLKIARDKIDAFVSGESVDGNDIRQGFNLTLDGMEFDSYVMKSGNWDGTTNWNVAGGTTDPAEVVVETPGSQGWAFTYGGEADLTGRLGAGGPRPDEEEKSVVEVGEGGIDIHLDTEANSGEGNNITWTNIEGATSRIRASERTISERIFDGNGLPSGTIERTVGGLVMESAHLSVTGDLEVGSGRVDAQEVVTDGLLVTDPETGGAVVGARSSFGQRRAFLWQGAVSAGLAIGRINDSGNMAVAGWLVSHPNKSRTLLWTSNPTDPLGSSHSEVASL